MRQVADQIHTEQTAIHRDIGYVLTQLQRPGIASPTTEKRVQQVYKRMEYLMHAMYASHFKTLLSSILFALDQIDRGHSNT
tara:strand:- start:451 stop:693 length:243 start_codon:yes stop_codon:yes gene_type:complete